MTLTYTPQEAKEALEVEKIIQAKAPTIKIHMVSVDLRTEAACLNLVQEHLKVFGTLDTL
jgi:hypothetical protein